MAALFTCTGCGDRSLVRVGELNRSMLLGVVGFGDDAAVVECNGSTLAVWWLNSSRPRLVLRNPFGGVDSCLSAHPVWGGDGWIAFPAYGIVVDLGRGSVVELNVSRRVDVNGSTYVLYDVFRGRDGGVYYLYLDPAGGRLYLEERGWGGGVSRLALGYGGRVLYAGFLEAGGRTLLFVVNGDSMGVPRGLAVYSLRGRRGERLCGLDVNGAVVFPLSLNFGDVDGDGLGDVVLAYAGGARAGGVGVAWVEVGAG